MNDLVKFDLGRVRAWFEYERWITDIDSIMKELDKNSHVVATYSDESCCIVIESIDNKLKSVDELISIVNDAVSKVHGDSKNA